MIKKLIAVILLMFLFSPKTYSQNFCLTDEYNTPLMSSNPEKYEEIEDRLQNYIKNNIHLKNDEEIVIPVVFHIVWIDERMNIPEYVIQEQLDVLNTAFNAENADTSILTDTLKNWVGNFKLRFELAHIDPNGFFTTGITRTKTINPHFSAYLDNIKKSHYGIEPWPTDRYLNIWIGNLLDGFHGYSQFPGGPEETDGVVVDWQTVGKKGGYSWTYPNNENLAGGKVLVHEIGHWLNLYHPWGNTNSGCGDDYIPETGRQDSPIYPEEQCYDTLFSTCSPSERVFVKHYMDYSHCDCMVTFTKGQVERGLASLHTYREGMLNSLMPRPDVNNLSETAINPTITTGGFYIQLPDYDGFVSIYIFDAIGSLIEYRHVTETTFNVFDITKNSNGMYFIKILDDNNNIFSNKILKIN